MALIRARVRSRLPKSEINVTPLIDVLLVLLVIFMVITPTTSVGLRAEVPQRSVTHTGETPTTLVLTLDRKGVIRLNSEVLDFTTLSARLMEVFMTRPDRTLFVQADDDILFNEVARIIDTARGAGVDRVGLMTDGISSE
jgi:biopolymer transport protein TolR